MDADTIPGAAGQAEPPPRPPGIGVVRITFEVDTLDLEALIAAGLNSATISQILLRQIKRGEPCDVAKAFNEELRAKTFVRRLLFRLNHASTR